MIVRILSSKWMSLFCTVVNSTFCVIAWNNDDYFWFVLCAMLTSLCAWNFAVTTQEEGEND